MTGYLADLVAASSNLAERVDGLFAPAAGAREEAEAHRQLARWKAMCADAGSDAFARRLALDGWTEATITPLLAEVRFLAGAELPSWASLLGGCVDAMLASTPDDPRDDVRPGRPPRLFEQVFSPALRFASAELRRRSPTTLRLLSATALAEAETALLESLVQVSAATLTLEFQAFRSVREPTLFRMLRRVTQQRSSELYRDFLTGLRSGGLLDLLSTYPVLGRFWGLMVETWIQKLTEMVERLDRDRALLLTRLGVSDDQPALDHLTMAMSDRHQDGRSVMLLTLRDGGRIIYKPKGLGLEKAFSDLLGWLNSRGSPVHLRGIEVVDRGAYGWVEFVEATGCERRTDIATYYRRAGGLLCLVHLLEGTDCHLENIVASGPDPVLVDAEALLHHRTARDRSTDGGGDLSALQQHWRSVLRTGLLPTWTLDHDGNPVDTSGLGGFGDQATARQFLGWENVNTDEMQFGERPGRLPQSGNVPSLGGVPQSPLDFRHELVSGFTQMYRFCQREKSLLAGPEGPLHAFVPQASRFIARDSALYGRICAGLVQPLALTSGIAQTLQLEALAVGHLAGSGTSEGWPLLRAEMVALQRLDIPYFSGTIGSADLDLPTGTRLPGFFEGASMDAARSKISNTSAADLRDQVRYIEATLFSRAAELAHPPEGASPGCAPIAQSPGGIWTPSTRASSSPKPSGWPSNSPTRRSDRTTAGRAGSGWTIKRRRGATATNPWATGCTAAAVGSASSWRPCGRSPATSGGESSPTPPSRACGPKAPPSVQSVGRWPRLALRTRWRAWVVCFATRILSMTPPVWRPGSRQPRLSQTGPSTCCPVAQERCSASCSCTAAPGRTRCWKRPSPVGNAWWMGAYRPRSGTARGLGAALQPSPAFRTGPRVAHTPCSGYSRRPAIKPSARPRWRRWPSNVRLSMPAPETGPTSDPETQSRRSRCS